MDCTTSMSAKARSRRSLAGDVGQGGFSLVEVLIASVLLLVIALGILPLFVRAIGLNTEGRTGGQVALIGASELERLNALPWNAPELTIPAGAPEASVEQYQLVPQGEWMDETEVNPDDGFHFHRILRVRQFGLGALADGKLERSEAIPGGTTASGLIQIKEIVVQVESGKVPGADRRSVTMRLIRGV